MTIFKKPWKLADGFLFGGALALLGFIIQIVAGPVDRELIASPVNLVLLAVFLAFVVAAFLLKRRFGTDTIILFGPSWTSLCR